ncbi:MAG: hypothetical protein FK734_21525 [Asgard group archaeon]|nr:hypothetical protein [Asgard group archaeon]
MTEYMITKEQCQKNIHGICPQCGGLVEPIETVDNSDNPTFWAGCKICNIFTTGVTEKCFAIATELVDNHNFVSYHSIDSPDGRDKKYEDYYRKRQIGGACRIVGKVLFLSNQNELNQQVKK